MRAACFFYILTAVFSLIGSEVDPVLSVHGLKRFVYVKEARQLTVSVRASKKLEGVSVRPSWAKAQALSFERIPWESGALAFQAKALVSFRIPEGEGIQEFRIQFEGIDCEYSFSLVPLTHTAKIEAERGRFRLEGKDAVLVLRRVGLSEHRRWGLLKTFAQWQAAGNEECTIVHEKMTRHDAKPFYEMLPKCRFRPDLLGVAPSLVNVPLMLAREKELPKVLVLSMTEHDLMSRVAKEDIVRTIDACAQLLRRSHKVAPLYVLTPFPRVGMLKLSTFYAKVLRDAARHAHVALVDLHGRFLESADWRSRFVESEGVYLQVPDQKGQAAAAALLKERLGR